MALHFKNEGSAMSDINVTPLVDVMLVLLVVFIVTAPLLTRAVRIDLPRTAAAPMAQTRHVQVSMDANGVSYMGQRAIAMEALEGALREELRRDHAIAVQVHADRKTSYGQVAQLMAAIQRAGVTKIALVTQPQ